MPEPDNENGKKSKISAGVLVVVLWIVTAILGLLDIVAIRNILIGMYSGSGGRDYWAAVNMANWSVVIAAMIWIVVVIGGGEYHRSRVGQRSSWRLFGWTIGVEAAILILSLFV